MLDLQAVPTIAWVVVVVLALLGALWCMHRRSAPPPLPFPVDEEMEEEVYLESEADDEAVDEEREPEESAPEIQEVEFSEEFDIDDEEEYESMMG